VLVTARRMHELHLTSETAAPLEPLEVSPRSPSAPELTGDGPRPEVDASREPAADAQPGPALDRTREGALASELVTALGRDARDTAYLEEERPGGRPAQRPDAATG
jgi:DNA recombination protein RmuC